MDWAVPEGVNGQENSFEGGLAAGNLRLALVLQAINTGPELERRDVHCVTLSRISRCTGKSRTASGGSAATNIAGVLLE